MDTQESWGEMTAGLFNNITDIREIDTGDVLATDDEGRVYMINFEGSARFLTEVLPVEQPKRFNTDGLLELLE